MVVVLRIVLIVMTDLLAINVNMASGTTLTGVLSVLIALLVAWIKVNIVFVVVVTLVILKLMVIVNWIVNLVILKLMVLVNWTVGLVMLKLMVLVNWIVA